MTKEQLKEAIDLSNLIDKFENAKECNFNIQINSYDITDAQLRPSTQSAIKELLLEELDFLKQKFSKL